MDIITVTPELLLDRARSMRVEAAQARKLAQRETTPGVRDGLEKLAAQWLDKARELERRALSIAPVPKAKPKTRAGRASDGQIA